MADTDEHSDSNAFYSSTTPFFTRSRSYIEALNTDSHRHRHYSESKKNPARNGGVSYSKSDDESCYIETNGGLFTHNGPHEHGSRPNSRANENKPLANGSDANRDGSGYQNYWGSDSERDGNDSKEDSEVRKTDEKRSKLKLSEMSRRSKFMFVMLCLANIGAGCGFSLPAPFFPREAEKKGASGTAVGLVFSTFQLVNFITAPTFGNFLTKIGAKFLYASGILVTGTTAVLFGFLDKGPGGTTFIVMSFLVRSVEALGVSASVTASLAIVSNEFPDHIGSVFATLETCIGIGLMVGPTVGAALYEVGGFGLPFWVIGAIIIVIGLIILILLPVPQDNSTPRKGSIFSLLKSPMNWIVMMCVMVGALGMTFVDPTLSGHLDQFGLSTLEVGLCFVIVPGIYALLAPVWGYISDAKDIQSPLLIGGNLVSAIGYLLLGPTPLLPFLPKQLWTSILGLVVYGFSIGCSIVPTMKCFVIGTRELGFPDDLNTFGQVSGLFNAMFCMGAFIGPTIGGALVDKIGFHYGSTIVAGFYLLAMAVSALYFGVRKLRKRAGANGKVHYGKNVTVTVEEDDKRTPFDERTPLLSESSLSKPGGNTISSNSF